jgi:hypothetical protein
MQWDRDVSYPPNACASPPCYKIRVTVDAGFRASFPGWPQPVHLGDVIANEVVLDVYNNNSVLFGAGSIQVYNTSNVLVDTDGTIALPVVVTQIVPSVDTLYVQARSISSSRSLSSRSR